MREAELMVDFDHQNLVRLIGVALQQRPWLVVLEFMRVCTESCCLSSRISASSMATCVLLCARARSGNCRCRIGNSSSSACRLRLEWRTWLVCLLLCRPHM